MSDTTIFALSSAPGRAGVAVIRISGPEAHGTLVAFCGRPIDARSPTLAKLAAPDTGDDLDRGLVLRFDGPASFTGEDVAELHVHGGPAVVAAVLAALGRQPALVPATPGDFTRRAFDNGKLDLTRIEALAALIDAETEAQRRTALAHLDGSLFRQAEVWRTDIISAMALIEAGLDFSDEGDVATAHLLDDAAEIVAGVRTAIRDTLSAPHRGELIHAGLQVVITGPVNAGKSSLLNALARREVAIVSDEPGTTRDIVEARLDLGGHVVRLRDTAGLRVAPGVVEAEGMRRARAAVAKADLVLELHPADASPGPQQARCQIPTPGVIRILSKSDVPHAFDAGAFDLALSTKTGTGLSDLITRLSEFAQDRMGAANAPAPLIATVRHRHELTECEAALSRFGETAATGVAELAAEDLRLAAHALGRLVGKVDVEDVLDRLFAGFCIGK